MFFGFVTINFFHLYKVITNPDLDGHEFDLWSDWLSIDGLLLEVSISWPWNFWVERMGLWFGDSRHVTWFWAPWFGPPALTVWKVAIVCPTPSLSNNSQILTTRFSLWNLWNKPHIHNFLIFRQFTRSWVNLEKSQNVSLKHLLENSAFGYAVLVLILVYL